MKQNLIAISFYARGPAGCSEMLCANTALNLCSLSQVSKQQLIFLVKNDSEIEQSGIKRKRVQKTSLAPIGNVDAARGWPQHTKEPRVVFCVAAAAAQSRGGFILGIK
jgi:hypothetical protein